MPRIIIATALLLEARAIARAFHLPHHFRQPVEMNAHLGIALIGPAARKLDLIREYQPHALIMAGLAGALSPELAIGDVVAWGDLPPSLPGLHHRLFVGRLTTSDTLVSTPAQKKALFHQTGALAVDMETQHAQFLANALQIPFLALRAISDAAADPLDPAVMTLVDPEGHPRIDKALLLLARHPSKLQTLLTLRNSSTLALSNLTATLTPLLAAGWPKSA